MGIESDVTNQALEKVQPIFSTEIFISYSIIYRL